MLRACPVPGPYVHTDGPPTSVRSAPSTLSPRAAVVFDVPLGTESPLGSEDLRLSLIDTVQRIDEADEGARKYEKRATTASPFAGLAAKYRGAYRHAIETALRTVEEARALASEGEKER